eukprot:4585932-Pyramimonas_sp.AAC.1
MHLHLPRPVPFPPGFKLESIPRRRSDLSGQPLRGAPGAHAVGRGAHGQQARSPIGNARNPETALG